VKRWLGPLIVLGSVSMANADVSVSWEKCLEIASSNNPEFISTQRTLQEKQALYRSSYNGILPRVSLSNSYTDSKGHPSQSRWQAGGNASLDVFNTSRFADIRSARAGVDLAQANLRLTSADVLFGLRSAFAQLLFSQASIRVSRDIQTLRKRDSELVTLRYKSGRESRGNMLRAQAEYLQAQMDLAQSERDLKAAQFELARQLGRDEFEPIVATGTLNIEIERTVPAEWSALVDRHPSMAIQQSNFESARAGLAQSKSALWPALSANYSRSFRGSSEFPDDPDWSASGILSLPIFGGGLTAAYYNISADKRNLEKTRQDIRAARTQIRSELESAWSALQGASDQIEVQTAFLEAARQRNGEADIRYSSGLLSYENWEQIVTDRVNFERGLIRAKRDAVLAVARWEKSKGKGLGD